MDGIQNLNTGEFTNGIEVFNDRVIVLQHFGVFVDDQAAHGAVNHGVIAGKIGERCIGGFGSDRGAGFDAPAFVGSRSEIEGPLHVTVLFQHGIVAAKAAAGQNHFLSRDFIGVAVDIGGVGHL